MNHDSLHRKIRHAAIGAGLVLLGLTVLVVGMLSGAGWVAMRFLSGQ